MQQPAGINPRLSRNRCVNLRWKSLYIIAEQTEDDVLNDTALWCLHTSTCLGPDGKVVDHYECAPSRKCYEQL